MNQRAVRKRDTINRNDSAFQGFNCRLYWLPLFASLRSISVHRPMGSLDRTPSFSVCVYRNQRREWFHSVSSVSAPIVLHWTAGPRPLCSIQTFWTKTSAQIATSRGPDTLRASNCVTASGDEWSSLMEVHRVHSKETDRKWNTLISYPSSLTVRTRRWCSSRSLSCLSLDLPDFLRVIGGDDCVSVPNASAIVRYYSSK